MKRFFFLLPVLAVILPALSFAQTAPQLINYQGRLHDSAGMPLDSVTVKLTFGFYGAQSGGSVYLSVVQNNVGVSNGLYNVLIGSGDVTAGVEPDLASVFRNHGEVWMGVAVGADPEMTPRQRITSAPYSLAVDLAFLAKARDFDNDGYVSQLFGGDDCNDMDPLIYPGAEEIRGDGIDQSCDGYAFGPLDACRTVDQCGFLGGGPSELKECQQKVTAWISWGLTSVNDFRDCLEGSTNCTEVENCYTAFVGDARDEFCSALSTCGYMSDSSCQTEVSDNLGDIEDSLLAGKACIRDGGTCSREWLDRCMNSAGSKFSKSVQWENLSFSLSFEALILFSDTSQTYSVRNPRGESYGLSPGYDPWYWILGGSVNSIDELMSAWPSGEYTVLAGNTVKDIFTMPPYEDADFPKQVIAIHPYSGDTVSDNPLTLHWQLTDPGSDPAEIDLRMQNWTRGGYADLGDDLLSPDATTGAVPIPSGTQTGDTLSADVVTKMWETVVFTPTDRMFWYNFVFRRSQVYEWAGPPQ
ncbi:MAG: MopE-related protein [bacterium]